MLNEVFSHIHPILVHFPIALILIGTLYDLVQSIMKRAIPPTKRLSLWVLATLGALAAVATGPEHDAFGNTTLLQTHSTFADLTAWLSILVIAIRIFIWWKQKDVMAGKTLAAYMLIACLTSVSVLTAGYFGGKMVYDQGIGVKVNGSAVNPPKAFHRYH